MHAAKDSDLASNSSWRDPCRCSHGSRRARPLSSNQDFQFHRGVMELLQRRLDELVAIFSIYSQDVLEAVRGRH